MLLTGAASTPFIIIVLDGVFGVEADYTQVCVVVALFEGEVETGGGVSERIVCGLGYLYGLQNIF